MQPDPLGLYAGDADYYRDESTNPTNASDSMGLFPSLSAKKATGVLLGDLGAFVWGIKWAIAPKAESPLGGFIVQHVDIRVKLEGKKQTTLAQFYQAFANNPLFQGLVNADSLDYWEAWTVKPGKTAPVEEGTLPKGYIDAFQKMGVVMPGNIATIVSSDDYMWPWDKRADGNAKGDVTFKGEAWYFELPGRPCKPNDPRGDPFVWSSVEVFLKFLGFKKNEPGALAGILWYQRDSDFTAARKRDLMAQMHGNKVDHSIEVSWDEAIAKKTKLVSAVPADAA
jgi:hypothetical protein